MQPIYAAILIPFKAGIPIIPGFVELRPVNAIPLSHHSCLAMLRRGVLARIGILNGILEQAKKTKEVAWGQSAVSTVLNERV